MFRIFLTLYFCSFFSALLIAQAPPLQWEGETGGGNTTCIQQTSDGGYIATGSPSSDFTVTKYNSLGRRQWTKSYGGTKTDEGRCIRQTSDGGYIVGGTTLSNDGNVSGNHGGSDYWVIKLNSSGELQWQKCFGDTQNDDLKTLAATSDGGYILAGSSTLIKINSLGQQVWLSCSEECNGAIIESIHITSDGNIIAVGYCPYNITRRNAYNAVADFWIGKFNSAGGLQWEKTYGGSKLEYARSIQPDTDGNYIIVGSTSSYYSWEVTYNHGLGFGTDDYWVIKISGNGELLWEKALGAASDDIAYSIEKANKGGFIIVGSTTFSDNIFKINGQGEIQWQKTYPAGKFANYIQKTQDGGYIVSSRNKIYKLGPAIYHAHYHQLSQNPAFRQRKLLSENSADTYKVCADGSRASLFKLHSTEYDLSLAVLKFSAPVSNQTGNFSVIYQSADSLIVQYQHPDYLQPSNESVKLTAFLYPTSSSTTALTSFEILVYRAPVLLTHGLWSGPEAFSAMESSLIATSYYPSTPNLIKRTDYSATNNGRFILNVTQIQLAVTDLLQSLRTNRIAAGKVDFIGHSMGGILGRLYLQRSQNYYDDIRRIITLNTPHSGSQLANVLVNLADSLSKHTCEDIVKVYMNNMACEAGAMKDLCVDSAAIRKDLNGAGLNARIVPSHTIATVEYNTPIEVVFGVLTKRPVQVLFYLLRDMGTYQFFGDINDWIVGRNSQTGGLTGTNTTLINNQMHIGSPANTAVINRVKDLLIAAPTSSYFTMAGFQPVQLSNSVPLKKGAFVTGDLRIDSPTLGQYIPAGKDINISIKSTGMSGIETIVEHSPDSLFIGKSYSATPSFTMKADGSKSGKKTINVIGQTTSGNYVISSTYFYISNNICESVQSGNWNSASTWSCNRIPTDADVMVIKAGHVITISTATARAKRIASLTGKIMYSGASAKLFLKGGEL